MEYKKTTESESGYHHLEKMSVSELLYNINKEDETVASAVKLAIPQITIAVEKIVEKMQAGGRLFYIGAGTSGRLGILDASECEPTFGLPEGIITGVIAGGRKAITAPVEFAEDDITQGWLDLNKFSICNKDIVVGISAGGYTPYVLAALQKCMENKIITVAISCNANSPISKVASHKIEVIVGPEFITGSTRMKSGTAQKMVLNMISSSAMILQGYVENNKVINMALTNNKLIDRAVKIVMEKMQISDYETAKTLLLQNGSLKKLFTK